AHPNALAARGGRLAGALAQQEAGGGVGQAQARPAGLAEQAEMIEVGVGAEQRQLEAVLALDGAVAGAAVAAELAEQAGNVAVIGGRLLVLRRGGGDGRGQQGEGRGDGAVHRLGGGWGGGVGVDYCTCRRRGQRRSAESEFASRSAGGRPRGRRPGRSSRRRAWASTTLARPARPGSAGAGKKSGKKIGKKMGWLRS